MMIRPTWCHCITTDQNPSQRPHVSCTPPLELGQFLHHLHPSLPNLRLPPLLPPVHVGPAHNCTGLPALPHLLAEDTSGTWARPYHNSDRCLLYTHSSHPCETTGSGQPPSTDMHHCTCPVACTVTCRLRYNCGTRCPGVWRRGGYHGVHRWRPCSDPVKDKESAALSDWQSTIDVIMRSSYHQHTSISAIGTKHPTAHTSHQAMVSVSPRQETHL